MRVHYNSRMGYGFIVKRREYRELSNEKFNQFQESDYAFALDA